MDSTGVLTSDQPALLPLPFPYRWLPAGAFEFPVKRDSLVRPSRAGVANLSNELTAGAMVGATHEGLRYFRCHGEGRRQGFVRQPPINRPQCLSRAQTYQRRRLGVCAYKCASSIRQHF